MKYKYKLNIIDFWRVGELENWYAHLAQKGYHLHKSGRIFSKFKIGEPCKRKYRVELTSKQMITDEQLHLYEDSGWDYVTSYQYFHVFSVPASRDVPEIHSDPLEHAETFQQFSKILKRNIVILLLYMCIFIPLFTYNIFFESGPYYRFVIGELYSQYVMSFFMLVVLLDCCRSVIGIRKIKQQLQKGLPINHQADWRRKAKLINGILLTLLLVFLLQGYVFIKQIVKDQRQTLSEGAVDIPIVRLQPLEVAYNVKRDSDYMDDIDWGNQVHTEWSVLAPVQYETSETARSSTTFHENEGIEYNPTIQNDYYELRFAWMTRPFVESYIKRYLHEGSIDDYIETSHPSFDLLIVHTPSELYKMIFAVKDNRVIKVSYNGFAPLETLIEEIDNVL